MKSLRIFAIGWTFLAASSIHAQVITVFGLPLGGKAVVNRSCPTDSKQVKQLCWVDKPFQSSEGAIGIASIPDGNLPDWASHRLPEIGISKKGDLGIIRFTEQWKGAEVDYIVASISKRFKSPTIDRDSKSRFFSASWRLPDIGIDLSCFSDRCSLEFLSATEKNAKAQRIADQQAKNSARPSSP